MLASLCVTQTVRLEISFLCKRKVLSKEFCTEEKRERLLKFCKLSKECIGLEHALVNKKNIDLSNFIISL